MVGLAVVAEPLIKVLLTEKWMPSAPFLQIYCVIYALWPIQTANLQAINALGRSDIFLKLEIIKKVLGLIILFVTIPYGVYAIALGGIVSGLISTVINSYPNRELLDYGCEEQWKDIMPYLTLSLLMGAVVYSLNFLGLAAWITVLLQILLGALIYVGMAYLFKLECLIYLSNTIKELKRTNYK
jgi:O-antigen/teichoic acid export membrane protein